MWIHGPAQGQTHGEMSSPRENIKLKSAPRTYKSHRQEEEKRKAWSAHHESLKFAGFFGATSTQREAKSSGQEHPKDRNQAPTLPPPIPKRHHITNTTEDTNERKIPKGDTLKTLTRPDASSSFIPTPSPTTTVASVLPPIHRHPPEKPVLPQIEQPEPKFRTQYTTPRLKNRVFLKEIPKPTSP